MTEVEQSEVTQILLALRAGEVGESTVTNRLFELVYDELRSIAGRLMKAERADHTLQPTELVHEAYRRLVDQTQIEWQSRAHFFGIAARAMRQILVDHARQRARAKRGGGWRRVTVSHAGPVIQTAEVEVLELDEILTRLAEMDRRLAQVVELRIFGGLTGKETAHVLGISRRTVTDDWRVAKMWLHHELTNH